MKPRRILLFSAAFPPRTEVGAARWEGFAPFLDQAGWGLDVVLEDPFDLAAPDWARRERLPESVRIATYRREALGWHMRLLAVRRMLFPHARRSVNASPSSTVASRSMQPTVTGIARRLLEVVVQRQQSLQCVNRAYQAGRTLRTAQHQLVVSSGPPHYAHIAAARMSRELGVPHIVDLRDPWSAGRSEQWTLERWIDGDLTSYQHTVLSGAARIITNTPAARRALSERLPTLAERIIDIPNGTDLTPQPAMAERAPAPLRIAHCGLLYLDRDPRPFLKAAARVAQSAGLTREQFEIVFMGPPVRIDGRPLEEWGREFGLGDMLEVRPPGSRDDARDLLRSSSIGVAFQGENPTQIPAKVFEYLAFPLWLLALVGKDSATSELLTDSSAVVLDLHDEAGIERVLRELLSRFRNGERPVPVGADGRFSRERQARTLLAQIEQVVPASHSR